MTRAVITGAGLVTPVAQSPSALHDVLCAGEGTLGHISTFSTAGLPCAIGACVDPAVLRAELAGRPIATIDKTGQLAIVGAQRALASADFGGMPPDLGLVLGTMFSSAHTIGEFDRRAQVSGPEGASPLDFANTVLNAAAGQTAIRLSLHGVNATIAGGHTSGLQAIAYASDLVAGDRAPALLAGGVEELGIESYLGFCRAGLMCGTNGRPGQVPVPFDTARTGLALGEGAAFVVIETKATAAARGARILAEVAGHAALTDPDAMHQGYCGREVIAAAIRNALDRSGVGVEDIDAVSAAANGSYAPDEEEGAALAQVFAGRDRPPAITAIKSVLGETLGASGPLQVIAMVEAMRDGRLPGVRGLRQADGRWMAGALSQEARCIRIRCALVTAASPDGPCCAVVLRAAGEAE
jgi:3-oxoacyl-[acyl-carrier-protein] synthase II